MNLELLDMILDITERPKAQDRNIPLGVPVPLKIKRVSGRALSYNAHHKGQWFKPEYDLTEIQIAQDTDAYIFKAIQLKVERLLLAGWELVSKNEENLKYVKSRISEIEFVSGIPFELLIQQTATDLLRYSNCMWVKVRNKDASTGKMRRAFGEKELEPVAGYFLLPFETLAFKTKPNGEIKKIKQKTGEREKEFPPQDIVHFYNNKKPGFAIGTPELLPVVDDVRLLRQIEEEIEELINGVLQPIFHWKVGSDQFPERMGPDGKKESEVIKAMVEYMPATGIYFTDHRSEIKAIGSEGRALRAENYLEYFKKRVFSGLGVSPVDMGEDKANRAVAGVLSKVAAQHVEALQLILKIFIDKFVINELLLESGRGFSVFSPENLVEIKFGVVDKEEKMKIENQTIQLWSNNLITETESRKRLGEPPLKEEERAETFFKLYEEPLAMLKGVGNAEIDLALAQSETSGITPEGLRKQEQQRKEEAKIKAVQGRPNNPSSTGQRKLSASKSRPSNQHGTRTAPKLTKDILDNLTDTSVLDNIFKDGVFSVIPEFDGELDYSVIEDLKEDYVYSLQQVADMASRRLERFCDFSLKDTVVLGSLQWRIDQIFDPIADEVFEYGRKYAKLELSESSGQ